jgi:hypothetical protein
MLNFPYRFDLEVNDVDPEWIREKILPIPYTFQVLLDGLKNSILIVKAKTRVILICYILGVFIA